jgi:hypothetical protein
MMFKQKSIVIPFLSVLMILMVYSCSKNQSNNGLNSNTSRLQLKLTDSPAPDVKEVWVNIQQVELMMGDTTKPIMLSGVHAGVYNLLDLTNGKDTLLADAIIPKGTIKQIRLVLGDNNYVVTNTGDKVTLKTPSAQESGLKVQVNQDVSGGILYNLLLDFDAGKSVHQAGNSGKYILKPVLRLLSFVPTGGDIRGVVVPDSVRTKIFAIMGSDTVASTATDTTNGQYWLRDIPAGNYNLSFIPSDTIHKTASAAATVVLGQITTVDTVKLVHK